MNFFIQVQLEFLETSQFLDISEAHFLFIHELVQFLPGKLLVLLVLLLPLFCGCLSG